MQRVNLAEPEFAYDPVDPAGFTVGSFRFGGQLGAAATGTTLYEIPPGQAVCPYHYEVNEEEWLLVLSGHPSVRTPAGTTRLDPLDCVFFPPGPEGAHAVRNDSDETVRVLMYGQNAYPGVCVYPDSDKIGVYTHTEDSTGIFRRSASLDYYDGER